MNISQPLSLLKLWPNFQVPITLKKGGLTPWYLSAISKYSFFCAQICTSPERIGQLLRISRMRDPGKWRNWGSWNELNFQGLLRLHYIIICILNRHTDVGWLYTLTVSKRFNCYKRELIFPRFKLFDCIAKDFEIKYSNMIV